MVPELLTIPEAAKLLRLSRSGLKKIVARGDLPVVRFPSSGKRAGRVLFRASDLKEFIEKYTCGDGRKNGRDGTQTATYTQPQPVFPGKGAKSYGT